MPLLIIGGLSLLGVGYKFGSEPDSLIDDITKLVIVGGIVFVGAKVVVSRAL